ncbi:hypothetical protein WN943_006947 [Citrus x changshan-huyou]
MDFFSLPKRYATEELYLEGSTQENFYFGVDEIISLVATDARGTILDEKLHDLETNHFVLVHVRRRLWCLELV